MTSLPQVFNAATHFVDRNVDEGRGDHVAIECGDERVTYRQVAERVNRFGSALRALGVRQEQRIVLILQDTPAFAYCFFGAIKAGIVPIPLNTLWKAKDYQHALNDSGACALVISEALLKQFQAIDRAELPRLDHVIVVPSFAKASEGKGPTGTIDFEKLLAESSPTLEPEPTHRDAMAFWLYSSGSTGGPKGCVHLQHDMFVCAETYAKGVLGMRESDRCFSAAKLFFAYGLGNALYMPFAVGATTILLPDPPTAPRVYEVIERYRPTLLFSVPTNFGMLLAHLRQGSGGQAHERADRDFDLSSVRYAVSAGEALPESLFRRFKQRFDVEILDAIGSTECLHMFIANRPGNVRPGSSGQIVPGYDARIVDDDDRPLPVGEMGNLLIKGDSTCAFYWNQHEKTKQTIQGDWIRTGDKYYRDADGFYFYGGRTDDMLKAGGIWVSPIEIENVLIDHEAVQECAVIGREDGDGLAKPFAYVVLKAQVSGSPELATALQQFVRDRLAEYKRPRGVEFVPELPKTATGKLQRFKLRAAANG